MDFLIHHMLQRSASRFSDKEALVGQEERLTFQAAAKNVTGIAEGLRQAGIRSGDGSESILKLRFSRLFHLWRIPGWQRFVPINSLLFPDQVAHIANDCQMRGLITPREKLTSLASIPERVPSLEFVVVSGGVATNDVRHTVYDLAELLTLTGHQDWRDWGIGKDLAAILYTSGSTGKPKGDIPTKLGNYYISSGRRHNMIKSSGFRISPTEVEEVFFQRNPSSSILTRSPESQTLSKAVYCVRPPLSEFPTEH
jgi:acyl-CoA synthetase (AMP-forming)/AMP-acid ligase II